MKVGKKGHPLASEGSLAHSGELVAPPGLYRVVGVDTFEAIDADYLVGDFSDIEDAVASAAKRAGTMMRVYVYDDGGRCVWSGGTR